MASITRRSTLQGSAALAAACKIPGGGDDSVSAASQIDTIVITMLENRSFDHWFGGLSLQEGRTDIDGPTLEMFQQDHNGTAVAPFLTEDLCIADPPHSWRACHDQFGSKGDNSGFVTSFADEVGGNGHDIMGVLTRPDLPISYALADNFALCTKYFSSAMTSTYPNRYYGFAATSDGIKTNEFPPSGGFTFRTIWNALDEAGVSWKYYYSNIPVIGLFKNMFERGNVASIDEFYEDAAAGTLPSVVWVDPDFFYNDAHPPQHPTMAELFLASIYEALATSPQWNRMLFMSTFDEHGGFWDHVVPPSIDDDHQADGFGQLGFRVPTLAMGPFVKQGPVDAVLDHSSWIRFVCERFDIPLWKKRLEATTSLATVLDEDRMASGERIEPPVLPTVDFDPVEAEEVCAINQALPDDWQINVDYCLANAIPLRQAGRGPFIERLRDQGLID